MRNQVTPFFLVDLFFFFFLCCCCGAQSWKNPFRVPSQLEGKLCWQTQTTVILTSSTSPPFLWIFSLCAYVSVGPRDPTQIRAGQNHKLCAGRALTGSPPLSLPGFISFFLFRMSPRKECVKVVFPLGMKNMSPDSNTIHISSVDGNKHCQNAMKVWRPSKHYLPIPASSNSVYKKGIRGSWNPPRLLVYTPTTLLLVFTSLSNHESTVGGPAGRHIVL